MSHRIAVVDDDARFRRVVRLLLTRRGYTVVGEAGDIAAALALVDAIHPQSLLADWHLPDGDAPLLLACLAERTDPPRILLTSSDAQAGAGLATAVPFVPKERLADVDLARFL
ncbi:response regulator [Microbacterium rhizophilus]|uniref:response regulator n=1 Tax=Microbacterium rhizophilus TaxID=3138934 RepID=UPI0031E9BD11